jgi:organic hydroperoxide reductase OsmC/OhrA
MRDDSVHRYAARCTWSGSTAAGYEAYDRAHRAETVPPTAGLTLSSDPAFRGDPTRLDPEQLLLVAASSCQLLSFLAVAARARIDVVEYDDHAEAVMPDEPRPRRITSIILRPRIVVRGDASDERVRHLVDVAHRECFIANTLNAAMHIEPAIERRT